jgi:hypothetical protein
VKPPLIHRCIGATVGPDGSPLPCPAIASRGFGVALRKGRPGWWACPDPDHIAAARRRAGLEPPPGPAGEPPSGSAAPGRSRTPAAPGPTARRLL